MASKKKVILPIDPPSIERVENSENLLHHIIYHCQTKLNIKKCYYTWNIKEFSTIFSSINNLKTYAHESLPFNIVAHYNIKHDILYFCSWFESKCIQKKIKVNYRIYVETTEGIELISERKNYDLIHDKHMFNISVSNLYKQKSKYLPNDTLTLCLQFEIIESLSHKYIKEDLLNVIEYNNVNTFVLNKQSDSLVTLVVDKKPLTINKTLLCSKSDVFAAMFNSGLKESINNVIEIDDIEYNVLKYVLSFIETGNLDKDLTNPDNKNVETVYALIAVANKYNIPALMTACENFLIINTIKDNVIRHLTIAHLHNAQVLEKYAIKFIKLYEHNIVKTLKFKSLAEQFPTLLEKIKEEILEGSTTLYS